MIKINKTNWKTMMFIAILSFWIVYFGIGYLYQNNSKMQYLLNHYISQHAANCIIVINFLLSFITLPLLSYIPTVIILPNHITSYFFRAILSIIISDIWLYTTHRLFHKYGYDYHKLHHYYVNPSPFYGLVVHPLEFFFSNYLSMMLPLLLISHQELMYIETAFVAFDILMSHGGDENNHPSAKYHTLYHQRMNCNYGFAYCMDYIFNTYQTS